jgi:hypothetical protein
MKQLEKILSGVDGYLISIKRDTLNGYYVLEVGLPPKWKYKSKDDVECESIMDSEDGILLKIFPKVETVVVDDLIEFLSKIIEFNKKFLLKEEEFNNEIANVKEGLEKKIQEFYDGLDSFKNNFFSELNEDKKE